MTQGRFITFEGGEGTGKSTQVARLVERLRARDLEVVQTREPGGSQGAEEIRNLALNGDAGRWSPMTETLLMFAARSDHLERTVRPALEAGRWVVCRRRESCGGPGAVVFQRKKVTKNGCGALTKMGGGGTKWGEVGRSGVDIVWCCPLSEIFSLKPKLLDK